MVDDVLADPGFEFTSWSGSIAFTAWARARPRSESCFTDLEPVLLAHDGRPHRGKKHTRTAEHLRTPLGEEA